MNPGNKMIFLRAASCTEYERYWHDYAGDAGSFSFACDENGLVSTEDMNSAARENYRRCMSGEFGVSDKGIRRERSMAEIEAAGRCTCGEITLQDESGHYCCCWCDREYDDEGNQVLRDEQNKWKEVRGK